MLVSSRFEDTEGQITTDGSGILKHPRLVLRFVDTEPGAIDGLYSETDSIKINASHEYDF